MVKFFQKIFFSNFCKKWGKSLLSLLGFWQFVFLVFTIFCIWFSITYSDNKPFSILLTIMASFFAGLSGSFIKEDIGNSMLENKGLSAVRNLSSINFQIRQIREWIKLFISKKITKRDIEEINRHLGTTELNIKSGLEDWTDIVPELRKSNELVKNYEGVIREYFEELVKSKKELLVVGNNVELKEKLEKRIKELEKEMRGLKKETPQVLSRSFSGVTLSPNFASSVLFGNKTCSICGKIYADDFSSPMLYGSNICPECRKNYPNFGDPIIVGSSK